MIKRTLILTAVAGCVILMAGCGDSNSGSSPVTTPTVPTSGTGGTASSTDFETVALTLAQKQTCESNAPTAVDTTDFTYTADQDVAEPNAVDGVSTGCG
jgi:uncharacterized protein YggE